MNAGPIGAAAGGTALAAGRGLPESRAARLHRPSVRDTRLLVGVVLVLAAALLGARAVAAADSRTPYWAARDTLPVGARVTPDALVLVRASLGERSGAYLDGGLAPPAGLVVLRAVGAGELVPRSAVGRGSALALRPVTVPVQGPVPSGVRPGALVDVWASAPREDGGAGGAGGRPGAYATPRVLVAGAQVHAVVGGDGPLGSTGQQAVEVLVDPARLPAVLDALANEARTVLVAVPGSAPGGAG
ncbi:MAG: hypothetical protein GXX79_05745 [Actinomycetales bacterium]|nr:hypothetical protein [Actinomycetales bacterium]